MKTLILICLLLFAGCAPKSYLILDNPNSQEATQKRLLYQQQLELNRRQQELNNQQQELNNQQQELNNYQLQNEKRKNQFKEIN